MGNRFTIMKVIAVGFTVMLLGMLLMPLSANNLVHNIEALSLQAGDLMIQQIGQDSPLQSFLFTSWSDNPAMLIIESFEQDNGPIVRVRDAATDEMIAQVTESSTGVCLRLRPETRSYLIELEQVESVESVPYGMIIWQADSNSMDCREDTISSLLGDTPVADVLAADIPFPVNILNEPVSFMSLVSQAVGNSGGASGDCTVTSNSPVNVNLRSRPSINGGVIGSLGADIGGTVLHILPDATWLHVDNGVTDGWLSTAFVESVGDCDAVQTVDILPDGTILQVLTDTLDLSSLAGDLGLAELAGIPLDLNPSVNVSADGVTVSVDGAGGLVDINGAVGTDGSIAGSVNVGGDGGVSVDVGGDGAGVNVGGDGGVSVDVGGDGAGVNVGGDGGVSVDVGGDGASVNVGGDGGVSVDIGSGGIDIDLGGGDDDDGGGGLLGGILGG